MVSNKQSRVCNARSNRGIAHHKQLSLDTIPSISSTIINELSIHFSIADEIETLISNFLYAFYNASARLKSPKSLDNFNDACKRRYSDITNFIKEVSVINSSSNLRFVDKEGFELRTIINPKNDKVVLQNGELIYEFTFDPKAYRYLYQALHLGIVTLVSYANDSDWEDTRLDEELSNLYLAISTIAKIYEDLRGSREYYKYFESQAYMRLRSEHHLDKSSYEWKIFQNVLDDISVGIGNPRLAPRYIRDICLSIKNNGKQQPYTVDDYHVSMRSTGTYVRGKKKSIPGLYASMLEVNPIPHLAPLGYSAKYRQDPISTVDQTDRLGILIEQSKLSPRLIFMASNAIQDYANYYHNWIIRVLRPLKVDCTFNQASGIQFAKRVSSPVYWQTNHNNIYCLDISKATDTLNKEFQRECLSIILGSEESYKWQNIVTGETKLNFSEAKVVTQQCGQPQGYKSSFPAFAWVHHIIMRMVMKHHGLEEVDPLDFYRVLGDDSIISCRDEGMNVRDTYIRFCKFINWTVHPSKGYTFQYGKDSYALAEFAKVRLRDGQYFSPIPIKLLLSSVKGEFELFNLKWWSSKYIREKDVTEVLERLVDLEDIVPTAMIWKVISSIDQTMYSDFKINIDLDKIGTNIQNWTILHYFYAKLEDTLVGQFISDHHRSSKHKSKYVNPFLDTVNEKLLIHNIENIPEHKYWSILERNDDIIRALNELFGHTAVNNGILSLKLTDEETNVIYTAITYLIDQVKYLDEDGNNIIPGMINVFKKAINILNKYNPRSDTKATMSEWDVSQCLLNRIVLSTQTGKLLTESTEQV